jgi:hypothetical protein
VAFWHQGLTKQSRNSSPTLIRINHAGTCRVGNCRLTKGDKTMQGLKGVIVIAMIVTATVALGGCFHHDQQVAATPLK